MRKSLVGCVFGRLRVVGRDTEKSTTKRSYLRCVCRCGVHVSVYRSNLISGSTTSCGCLFREVSKDTHTLHGYSHLPEYSIWIKIKHRCLNTKSSTYPTYGGRGITLCARWKNSFPMFLSDMGPRPTTKHQIERKDNDKGYYRSNCKWATCTEQSRNRRSTRLLEYAGKTQCLLDWAREYGIRRETLAYRLNAGWSIDEALSRGVGE